MPDKAKPRILTRSVKKNLAKVFLRSLPILPFPEIVDLLDDLKRSRKSVDEKIQRACDSLKETTELIDELEAILKERTETVARLRDEYERYSKLAETEEEKARALIEQLEVTLGKGKNTERWLGFLLNLIAGVIVFILGILLGPKVTSWLGIGGTP